MSLEVFNEHDEYPPSEMGNDFSVSPSLVIIVVIIALVAVIWLVAYNYKLFLPKIH